MSEEPPPLTEEASQRDCLRDPLGPILLFAPGPKFLETALPTRRHFALEKLEGHLLLEIFSVHIDFPFRGTIHLIDGHGSHSIYVRPSYETIPDFCLRKIEWLEGPKDSEFKYTLLLNGSLDGMSAAFDGFTFEVTIAETDEYYELSFEDWETPLMLNEVSTATITTDMGSLYFTYAMINDAVRANVDFMVRLPWEASRVHGHIMAYIGTFEIGSTLFSKDVDNAAFIDLLIEPHVDSGVEFRLPLDRTCFPVPIGSSLRLKGELVFNGSDKVSINHSIPMEGLNFQSAWVQDNYCHTAVHVHFQEVWM